MSRRGRRPRHGCSRSTVFDRKEGQHVGAKGLTRLETPTTLRRAHDRAAAHARLAVTAVPDSTGPLPVRRSPVPRRAHAGPRGRMTDCATVPQGQTGPHTPGTAFSATKHAREERLAARPVMTHRFPWGREPVNVTGLSTRVAGLRSGARRYVPRDTPGFRGTQRIAPPGGRVLHTCPRCHACAACWSARCRMLDQRSGVRRRIPALMPARIQPYPLERGPATCYHLRCVGTLVVVPVSMSK